MVSPLKVLIVIESHAKGAGGGPIYWSYLSKGLRRKGHEVKILSGFTPGISFASPNTVGILPVGVDLRSRSPMTLLHRLVFGVRMIPAVRDFARKWRPDIIHTVPPIVSEAALRAGKDIKVPVIASVLSHIEAQWSVLESIPFRLALLRWLERYALTRPFSRIICLTQRSRTILLSEGVPQNKLVHIPNAVDVEKFNPNVESTLREQLQIPSNSIVIGYAGTLTRDKGVKQLLQAFAKLDESTDHHLFIAGEGSDRAFLEKFVQQKTLRNVIFLGALDHELMPSFMKSLDICIIPSLTEVFPTSMLEALATGTPVMATSVGGVAEILEHDVGILLPNAEPNTIVKLLNQWMNQPERLHQLGHMGRNYVMKNHTWEQASLLIEEVYQECL